MITIPKNEGQKRIQSLIRSWMSELEAIEGWYSLPPHVVNNVRRAVVRIAWGAFKVGVLSGD